MANHNLFGVEELQNPPGENSVTLAPGEPEQVVEVEVERRGLLGLAKFRDVMRFEFGNQQFEDEETIVPKFNPFDEPNNVALRHAGRHRILDRDKVRYVNLDGYGFHGTVRALGMVKPLFYPHDVIGYSVDLEDRIEIPGPKMKRIYPMSMSSNSAHHTERAMKTFVRLRRYRGLYRFEFDATISSINSYETNYMSTQAPAANHGVDMMRAMFLASQDTVSHVDSLKSLGELYRNCMNSYTASRNNLVKLLAGEAVHGRSLVESMLAFRGFGATFVLLGSDVYPHPVMVGSIDGDYYGNGVNDGSYLPDAFPDMRGALVSFKKVIADALRPKGDAAGVKSGTPNYGWSMTPKPDGGMVWNLHNLTSADYPVNSWVNSPSLIEDDWYVPITDQALEWLDSRGKRLYIPASHDYDDANSDIINENNNVINLFTLSSSDVARQLYEQEDFVDATDMGQSYWG